ncbi:hypothetical protein TWF281_004468 [Arthrobotrys megalospora]
MEALVAIGLASNILGFVDFGRKLVSDARKIYDSKSVDLDAEFIARNIRQMAEELVAALDSESGSSGTGDEGSRPNRENAVLKDLATECIKLSKELETRLEGLKPKSGGSKWQNLQQAVKAAWKKEELDTLQKRLEDMSQRLTNELIPNHLGTLDRQLGVLIEQNQVLQSRRDEDLKILRGDLKLIADAVLSPNSEKKGFDENEFHSRPIAKLNSAVENAVMKGDQYSAEQFILSRLRFWSITHRQNNITSAHERTFEWAFDEGSSLDFTSWLSRGGNLYWISGKPGSGKSTLMKYLCRHQRTREYLSKWADGAALVTASFFFWAATNDPLMKSQQGLLRSLMYQVLREIPDLIPQVFPDQWNQVVDGVVSRDEIPEITSLGELLRGFQSLSGCLLEVNVKLCLFLDGLDEYYGRPTDIIQLVESLKAENIKLCVSSRPWNDFEAAFGVDHATKAYMEEFNKGDIKLYVSDTLQSKTQFQELVELEGHTKAMELVRDIVEASQGVFLWVYLVVRELSDGLTDGNKFPDLLKRLHSLPTDLNNYFERILFTVDEFYRDHHHTTTMFLITLEAQEPLPLMVFWFVDQIQDDPEYGSKPEEKAMTMKRMSKEIRVMRKRLNAYSKGLLESKFISTGKADTLSYSMLFNQRVDFLHRTVRDFLRTPDTQKQLNSRIRAGFNAEVAICQALLALIKVLPPETSAFAVEGPMSDMLDLFFRHSGGLEEASQIDRGTGILSDLDSTIQNRAETMGHQAISKLPWISFTIPSSCILLGVVESGLNGFLRYSLESNSYSEAELATMLLRSIKPSWVRGSHRACPVHETAQLLLERGANPNFRLAKMTVWQDFVAHVRRGERKSEGSYDLFRIFEKMMEHGADLKCEIPSGTGGGETVMQSIECLFSYKQVVELLRAAPKKEEVSDWEKVWHGDDSKRGKIKAGLKIILHGRKK